MRINQKYYSLVVAVKLHDLCAVEIILNDFYLDLLERGKHFRWFMKWMKKNNVRWNLDKK